MTARVLSSLSQKCEKNCSRIDRQVGHASFFQALAPGRGQAGVGAAGVVFAGAALQQPVALEAIDEPREAAARELCLLGEVAHPHRPPARLLEVVEHLVGGHRQAVGLLEFSVQPLGQPRVRSQERAPRLLPRLARLPHREGLMLRGSNIDGSRGRHGGPGCKAF